MDAHLHEQLKTLEKAVLMMIIADPTLMESMEISREDFTDAAIREVVRDMGRGNGGAKPSLIRLLKSWGVEIGEDGVRAAIVARLRRVVAMVNLEQFEPLAARLVRFEELCRLKFNKNNASG